MNVLITGGAGYIGTELCYQLAENPSIDRIVIYDNLSRGNYNLFIGQSKLPAHKITLIQGDILDSRTLRKALKDIDVVFHLAAFVTTPFSEQNGHTFEQVNHWGTAELVYAVEDSPSVKRLIYLSSSSVYGASNDELDVDSTVNPRSFYGISKMRGEDHIYRLFNKMNTYIARCSNVYGYSKSMRFEAVINKFMFAANYNQRITIQGSGNQHRSFIHIDKVVNVLCSLIDTTMKSNKFDLVDRVMSINQIADDVQEIYPDSERIYINQHMKLRELKIKKNNLIAEIMGNTHKSFLEELLEFKTQFSC